MRILLVTESRGWSGGAAQTLHLARGLLARQHSVWLACHRESEIARRAASEKMPLLPMRIRGDADLSAVWKLKQAITRHRIDICHAQHPKAHGVILLAALGLHHQTRYLVTRRVSFPVSTNIFSRWKYTSPGIDRYIAVSGGIRDVLAAGGVAPEKIDVIHSGVEPATFLRLSPEKIQEIKDRLNLKSGIPTIMKVANFSTWKGQAVLLQAAAAVLASKRPIQFVFVGRGTDGPELAKMADDFGIRSHVRFLGFRTDIADLLSLADISINSAIEGEGLSGALRESLMLGIPVIASDVSGNSELVQEGVTGKLVPANNPEALAATIQWMLGHPRETAVMAEEGKALVLRDFTVEQMVNKTETLYQTLAQSRVP